MSIVKLDVKPGVVRSTSPYSAPGRYVDMQWARFVDGFPQKIPGFRRTELSEPSILDGVCRALWAWRAQTSIDYCAFGTHKKLYEMHESELTDITPLRERVTGNLTDPFDTTVNSTIVVVHHTAHGQLVGDWVTLTASDLAGGLLVRGNFRITTVVDANTYAFENPLTALATDTTAGGVVDFIYYRIQAVDNPIDTTLDSPIVYIHDFNHGALAGDAVIVSGATAVGGLLIDGIYTILTIDLNGYTVDAGAPANATATGGGTDVSLQYEIHAGLIETTLGFGYGTGPYGMEAYGTPRTTATGVPQQLRMWHLENYGDWLLANPSGGGLYVWKPAIGGRAVRLYGSPLTMNSFFITAERYIISLGINGNGMEIAWPDQNNPEDWIASEFNTANQSRKINGGNYIICGVQVRNQTSLIWTDTAVFLHQWRPDDFVFTTTVLADQAGILGPQAFAHMDETVYWVSDGRFLQWNGAMSELPSADVGEWFYNRLNDLQRGKIYCNTIAAYSEIIILYQADPGIGKDIDSFLLYSTSDRVWSTNFFDHICTNRTAVLDRGLFRAAIATSYDGKVYDHGIGHDAFNQLPAEAVGTAIPSWVTAAPMDLQAGVQNLDIFSFLPDFTRLTGDMSITVLTRTRAMNSIIEDGPFLIRSATPVGLGIDIRVCGNMAGYTLLSNVVGGDYRVGMCRVEVQGAGNRRAA
jgi:hypothetical protein